MAKILRIFLLTLVSLVLSRGVWSSTAAGQSDVCNLPHECRIDSFHSINDIYAREFFSRSIAEKALICRPENGPFRSNFSKELAKVYLKSSCLIRNPIYWLLQFPRDLRTRLDENLNLQGMIDFIFYLQPYFVLYLRNLAGFGVDLGLRENFKSFNNTPVRFFEIISTNTVFDFYKTNNGKRIESCLDMKLDNGSTLIPNTIFQLATGNESSIMVFMNCKFK